MALRDKLGARVQPMLEPGEQVQEVILSQTGPNPFLAVITYLVFFMVKRRIIVATDRAIVVIKAGAFTGTSAKEVIARLPRATRLGPVSGLWAKVDINGEKNYIHKRFHGDVARADSVAVPAHAGTGAPLPPPPGA